MGEPDVRVLHGSLDDDELAALVAVLSAVAGAIRAGESAPPVPRPRRPTSYPASTSWRTRR
ncbi:acyl-CoA carboxylase subunit epsilon [Saccharothrix longispora]|uniref:Acyl-CoA carboxylase epsilon subunit-like protein n=1 Tax=Saccharothrix longispora TaxID=33920 RepID=A0ABU1PVH6_9PSEU|nr:acyl-CoA carboxylase subunit epsilon [Saccharothrix longispora]MDR6594630.1 hypothetical protein [Saccharothrix longispora]